jgi:mannose-6-phosphate isomerase-like protein (cupin superfamily)
MAKQFKLFTLNNVDAPNFTMTPLELHEYIDFEVKRIYFVTNPKTGISGEHCHYKEEELFVLIQGSATAVIDKGNGKEEIPLKGAKNAMYVPNYVWHGFKKFSNDAILLAVSSTNYSNDRSDYLEDYNDYLKIRDEKLVK